MEKTYLIAFACFSKGKNYTNYQIQWAVSKKEALKIALERDDLKDAKCVLISIRRVRKSLANMILEHNKQIESSEGDANE